MYLYIQEVADYLDAQLQPCSFWRFSWKRCNEQGAFYGGMAGFILGAVRLTLAFCLLVLPECDQPDNRPVFIKDIHYMYVLQRCFGSRDSLL